MTKLIYNSVYMSIMVKIDVVASLIDIKGRLVNILASLEADRHFENLEAWVYLQ